MPDIVVARVGGATLTGCELGDIQRRGNAPTLTSIKIPVANTTALAELVNPDLTIDTTAVLEVTIGGVLLPERFVPTGGQNPGPEAVTIELADRRYEETRRYGGRTGSPASLTHEFYNATPGATPAGWTPNPGAPDALTFNPAGTGVFGVTAEEFTASGPGPMNCVSDGWIGDTVDYDRNVGFGAFVFLPSGAWAPNLDGQLVEILAYDTDQTDENGDNLVVDVAVANVTVSDQWILVAGHVKVPAGRTFNIELRLFAPDGTVLYQLAGIGTQEALSWSNVDVADIIIDLVAHANDNTWGHSDTGIRADATSIPDTGYITSRVVRSSEKPVIFDTIAEMCNVAGLWQHLTANLDHTETLHATPGGGAAGVAATDANADFGGWQWAGNDHADMLGIYGPDGVTDITGDKLIMWAADGAIITTLGASLDLGRELYIAGPYGNYDPRLVAGLLLPFAAAKKIALAASLTFKPGAAAAAFVAGTLRPGALLDATVGTWPCGVDDTFRIVSATMHVGSFAVTVELNRVAD